MVFLWSLCPTPAPEDNNLALEQEILAEFKYC